MLREVSFLVGWQKGAKKGKKRQTFPNIPKQKTSPKTLRKHAECCGKLRKVFCWGMLNVGMLRKVTGMLRKVFCWGMLNVSACCGKLRNVAESVQPDGPTRRDHMTGSHDGPGRRWGAAEGCILCVLIYFNKTKLAYYVSLY